jgi:hypothetical protein
MKAVAPVFAGFERELPSDMPRLNCSRHPSSIGLPFNFAVDQAEVGQCLSA